MPGGAASDPNLKYMDLAVRMARRGLGQTGSNPSVGAVIVDAASGEIIACGTTAASGRPHEIGRAHV